MDTANLDWPLYARVIENPLRKNWDLVDRMLFGDDDDPDPDGGGESIPTPMFEEAA